MSHQIPSNRFEDLSLFSLSDRCDNKSVFNDEVDVSLLEVKH